MSQDSAGRPIGVGDHVRWRGQIYTIKAFGAPDGRLGTRAIEFEEQLHIADEVPDEIAVDLVRTAQRLPPSSRCRWCGDDCPRWGEETCPFRPRQIPRLAADGHEEEP
jgi:hypothetical protein